MQEGPLTRKELTYMVKGYILLVIIMIIVLGGIGLYIVNLPIPEYTTDEASVIYPYGEYNTENNN